MHIDDLKTIEFPTPETKAKIAVLPQFTADVSSFIDYTPEEIAAWVLEQDGPIVINAANMQSSERARFEAANTVLEAHGKEIQLVDDEEDKVSEATRAISSEIVDFNVARRAFKDFVFAVLRDDPEAFISEYNTYFADAERENTYDTAHYWENVGLADSVDGLRGRVNELIEVVMYSDWEEGKHGRTFFDEFKEKVAPHLNEVPGVDGARDQCRASLLAMFSNMDRGIMYAGSSSKKVYGMRKMAVEHVEGAIVAEALTRDAEEDAAGMVRDILSADEEIPDDS